MTRAELLQSLLHVQETEAYTAPDGAYLDWSTPCAGGRSVEVGDGHGEAVQFDLTVDQIRGLHAALTLFLLTQEV